MGVSFRPWPRMMKRTTVCEYLEISAAALEREIAAGRLPQPIVLGNGEHWSAAEIEAYLGRMTGEAAVDDWRKHSKLYADG